MNLPKIDVQRDSLASLLMKMKKIEYEDLNSRQKENYNFQKVSGILAEYGFVTMRLSDDWNGADFIAQHRSGDIFRVQLKSRLTINKKYMGKELLIAFKDKKKWYLFPHDEGVKKILCNTAIKNTKSWKERGGYSWIHLGRDMERLLNEYFIGEE
jgi:hypothetical protein